MLGDGMNDYVTKPFDPGELFRIMAKWATAHGKPATAEEAVPPGGDEVATAKRGGAGKRGFGRDFMATGLKHNFGRREIFEQLALNFLDVL